jgi:hypothetical protein
VNVCLAVAFGNRALQSREERLAIDPVLAA